MPGLVFTAGRYQPPHPGHLAVVAAMRQQRRRGDAMRVYATLTHEPERNPLSPEEKREILTRLCPDAEIVMVTNPFNILDDLPAFSRATLVLGEDRRALGQSLAAYHPGLCVACVPRAPGALSATALRARVAAGDEAGFVSLYGDLDGEARRLYGRLRALGQGAA